MVRNGGSLFELLNHNILVHGLPFDLKPPPKEIAVDFHFSNEVNKALTLASREVAWGCCWRLNIPLSLNQYSDCFSPLCAARMRGVQNSQFRAWSIQNLGRGSERLFALVFYLPLLNLHIEMYNHHTLLSLFQVRQFDNNI